MLTGVRVLLSLPVLLVPSGVASRVERIRRTRAPLVAFRGPSTAVAVPAVLGPAATTPLAWSRRSSVDLVEAKTLSCSPSPHALQTMSLYLNAGVTSTGVVSVSSSMGVELPAPPSWVIRRAAPRPSPSGLNRGRADELDATGLAPKDSIRLGCRSLDNVVARLRFCSELLLPGTMHLLWCLTAFLIRVSSEPPVVSDRWHTVCTKNALLPSSASTTS